MRFSLTITTFTLLCASVASFAAPFRQADSSSLARRNIAGQEDLLLFSKRNGVQILSNAHGVAAQQHDLARSAQRSAAKAHRSAADAHSEAQGRHNNVYTEDGSNLVLANYHANQAMHHTEQAHHFDTMAGNSKALKESHERHASHVATHGLPHNHAAALEEVYGSQHAGVAAADAAKSSKAGAASSKQEAKDSGHYVF